MSPAPENATEYDPQLHRWPHCVSAHQITRSVFELIQKRAAQMLDQLEKRDWSRMHGELFDNIPRQSLANTITAGLILEPSTRTQTSFNVAAARLGSSPQVQMIDPARTSMGKAERWDTTVRVLCQYHPDAFVLRTPHVEQAYQAAALFGDYTGSHHPNTDKSWGVFINAGNGSDQHPTQALLDMFAIHKVCGTINGLRILIAGDIGRARTVNSLLIALAQAAIDSTIVIVAPVIDGYELSPPAHVMHKLDEANLNVQVAQVRTRDEFVDLARQADVGYWTRLQVERYRDELPPSFAAANASLIQLSPELLDQTEILAFHPMPYTDEVCREVEGHHQVMFLKQAGWGVPVRMALLELAILHPKQLRDAFEQDTRESA